MSTDSVDELYSISFATENEAIEYCKMHGYDYVVKVAAPEYADTPFVCVKKEWIVGIVRKTKEGQ